MNINKGFWATIDRLVETSHIIIDRPRGVTDPNISDFIYPVSYGYLNNSISKDNKGINVWVGSDNKMDVDAIICTISLDNSKSNVCILIGCTEQEKDILNDLHNSNDNLKGILIRRL